MTNDKEQRRNCIVENLPITKCNHLVSLGDLNALVGSTPIDKVFGAYGEYQVSINGQKLREFVTFNDLRITNIFFRKKDINKYTWTSRGLRYLIYYVAVNQKIVSQLQDIHVFSGYNVGSDHHIVCMI